MEPFPAILNIDKPLGITSHDVVSRLRRLVGTRRVGHAGTLDPLATGVLVLGIERATRLLEYVVGQPKTYLAQVRFGQTTTTYDAEGAVVSEEAVEVSRTEIETALAQFRGKIAQVPPAYSAVKMGGEAVHKRARRGELVELEPRQVTIYELEILGWEAPDLALRVVCSAGTYIRTLAHDLGQVAGPGAFLSGLRRTAVGGFTLASAVPLDHLSEENWPTHALEPDAAVQHLPELHLSIEAAGRLAQGQRLPLEADQPASGLVRVYDPAGHFVAIAAAEAGVWQPKKVWRT